MLYLINLELIIGPILHIKYIFEIVISRTEARQVPQVHPPGVQPLGDRNKKIIKNA